MAARLCCFWAALACSVNSVSCLVACSANAASFWAASSLSSASFLVASSMGLAVVLPDVFAVAMRFLCLGALC